MNTHLQEYKQLVEQCSALDIKFSCVYEHKEAAEQHEHCPLFRNLVRFEHFFEECKYKGQIFGEEARTEWVSEILNEVQWVRVFVFRKALQNTTNLLYS